MSNQLRIAARRAFARAPGVIGFYPAFQAAGDTALIDRSGAGNSATIGADATLSTMWTAVANRYTVTADDITGTTAKGASIPAAAIGWNKDAETLLISGIWRGANSAIRHCFGFGSPGTSTIHGVTLRSAITTGVAQISVYHSGGSAFSTAAATVIADGTDHHVALVIDGPAKRIKLWVDGAYDAVNNGAGYDFSAVAANLTALGPLVFCGAPSAAAKHLVYAGSGYGWHVAKRAGSTPANINDVMRRLARTPLQPLTATEWPE